MQLDYIIADEKAIVLRVWNDNMLPIGLDKKPSLCTLLVDMEKCKKRNKYLCKRTLKHWKPFLYEDGVATLGFATYRYQQHTRSAAFAHAGD